MGVSTVISLALELGQATGPLMHPRYTRWPVRISFECLGMGTVLSWGRGNIHVAHSGESIPAPFHLEVGVC